MNFDDRIISCSDREFASQFCEFGSKCVNPVAFLNSKAFQSFKMPPESECSTSGDHRQGKVGVMGEVVCKVYWL